MASEHFINNTNTNWQDLYALIGKPVGTRLQVQNQSSSLVLTRRSATRPSTNQMFGRRTRGDDEFIVDSGVLGCWIRCVTGLRLYIQADDE